MRRVMAKVAELLGEAAVRRRGALGVLERDHLDTALRTLSVDYPQAQTDPTVDSSADPVGPIVWTALGDIFQLTPAEHTILAVAIAPELDPNIGLVLSLLQGGGTRPTVAMALELAGVGMLSRGRSALTASAPLRRFSLVDLEGGEPNPLRRVRVADRLVEHVLGATQPDPGTLALAVTVWPVQTPESADLHRFLDHNHQLTYLRETPRGAGLATAGAALTAAGMGWLAIDLRRLSGSTPIADVLRRALLDAALSGRALVIAGFDVLADGDAATIGTLDGAAPPVIAIGSTAWHHTWTERIPAIVEVAPLSDRQNERLWRTALGSSSYALLGEDFAAPPLRAEEIIRAATWIRSTGAATGEPVTPHLLRRAALHLAAHESTPGLRRRIPKANRADLVLPDRTATAIDELIGWVRHRRKVFGAGPVAGKALTGEGITALFTGGPGTGKTMAADVVAGSLGLDLVTVELPALIDKYIGETQKNLEKVFTAAEEMNALLFFDEADALFGARSSVSDAHDRYANQEVAYLLQRMESFSGTAILATNLRGNLDPAFSRRLHFVVPFLDPEPPIRRLLWGEHLSALTEFDPTDPIDLELLVKDVDMTGGSVRNIVLSAAFGAAIDGSPVGMRHLVTATIREFEKSGRRLPVALVEWRSVAPVTLSE